MYLLNVHGLLGQVLGRSIHVVTGVKVAGDAAAYDLLSGIVFQGKGMFFSLLILEPKLLMYTGRALHT